MSIPHFQFLSAMSWIYIHEKSLFSLLVKNIGKKWNNIGSNFLEWSLSPGRQHFAIKNNSRLGFDSCSSYRAIESLGKDITNCVLDCEASLQSSYINCRSEYSPCSFMEQTPEWRHGISLKDVNSSEEFIDKVWENERTEKFRQSLLKTSCNEFNCRTCPYYEV